MLFDTFYASRALRKNRKFFDQKNQIFQLEKIGCIRCIKRNQFFLVGQKLPIFSKCRGCINICQNASKCMQNELCKCFVHEIIQNVILITSKGSKIIEIHLPLYGGTPCTLTESSSSIF